MDVFFFEAFAEEEESLKSYLSPEVQAGFSWKTIQEYGSEEPPAPIISVRTQSAIPEAWAPKLKAIVSRSTGYDHLRDYLQKIPTPIPLGYLPLYCNRTVAEQAMMLWMVLARRLYQQTEHFKTFFRDNLTGTEILGKTLLVVGVGHIGYEVVKIGQGLGMKVLGVDLIEDKENVDYTTTEQALPEADICVCAMDLRPENVGYFHYELLKKAKPGMLFVNISRGELSPAVDLLKALEEGILGGVALDVFNEEKALAHALRDGGPREHPEVKATLAIAEHPLGICTPHNAFNSHESVQRKSEQSVQQIEHFLKKGKLIWEAPV